MALVDITPCVIWPDSQIGGLRRSTAFADEILNADTESCAAIFVAPDTATVDHIGFPLRTVASAPSNSLDIEVLDLNNDGTLGSAVAGSSTSAETGITTSNDETWWESSITDINAALTIGEMYAVRWTLNGTGDVDIGRFTNANSHNSWMYDVGGTKRDRVVPITLRYDDDTYADLSAYMGTSFYSTSNSNHDASDTNEHVGAVLQSPYKCRVKAVQYNIDYIDAGGTYRIKVYTASSLTTTPTLQFTGSTQYTEQTSDGAMDIRTCPLSSTIEMAADDYIWIIVEATHATARVNVTKMNYTSSAERARYMGASQLAESNGGTTFTHTDTVACLFFAMVIDQLDNGVGGGASGGGWYAGE